MSFDDDCEEVRAVRQSLHSAGLDDVVVSAVFSNIDLRRGVGRTSYRAATVYRHSDGALHVAFAAKRQGGFKASLDLPPGTSLHDLATRILALRPNAFEPPTSLEQDVRVLAPKVPELLAVGAGQAGDVLVQCETELGAHPFVWARLAASERKSELKRAFDAAFEVLTSEAATPSGVVRHRRGLRARCWPHGSRWLVLWETDHDPSVGIALDVALFDRTPASAPW